MKSVLQTANLKYGVIIVCISFLCAIGISPQIAHAQTTQEQLVSLLIVKLHELQAQLATLQAQNNCPYLPRSLAYGMSGNDVSALQSFLARDSSIYPERVVNGYFDTRTVTAVQRYQARNGIVSSGSADTTGYGSVGPRTRSYVLSHCTKMGSDSTSGDLNGDLSLYSVGLDDVSWNVSDNTQNHLLLKVRNTADEDVLVQYRLSFEALDAGDEDPDDMVGTLPISKDDTAEVVVGLSRLEFFDNGNYAVKIEIDPEDDFSEDTESNNVRSITMTVSGVNDTNEDDDDFSVSDVRINDETWDIQDASVNQVEFDITNTFSDDEYVEYKITIQNDDTDVIAQTYRGSIRVDSFNTETVSWNMPKTNLIKDDYRVLVELDPDDDFDEYHESNNDESLEFDVINTIVSPTEVVDLKVNSSDTPATLSVTSTSTLSWTASGVNSCFLTVYRRQNIDGGYYSKRLSVPNTGSRNEKVTVAAPQGALSSVKLECTKNSGGSLLTDFVTVSLPTTVANYVYFEGTVIKQQNANLTEYRSLALCLKSAASAASTTAAAPWCEWNGGVIYGVRH